MTVQTSLGDHFNLPPRTLRAPPFYCSNPTGPNHPPNSLLFTSSVSCPVSGKEGLHLQPLLLCPSRPTLNFRPSFHSNTTYFPEICSMGKPYLGFVVALVSQCVGLPVAWPAHCAHNHTYHSYTIIHPYTYHIIV